MHQEPVEVPEQSGEDSSAFKLKAGLTDSNEIARYIEKFSQLPTDQIMDIYFETGIFSVEDIVRRRQIELCLNLPVRALSDGEISLDELHYVEEESGENGAVFQKYIQSGPTLEYIYIQSRGVVYIREVQQQ